jgi:hypothetical protein
MDPSITVSIQVKDPILPNWQKSIQICCPLVRGIYMNSNIPQSLIEPKVISQINSGTGVVDLTMDLLRQGISHWKNTKGKVGFHGARPNIKLAPSPPWPKAANYEFVRLGPQLIRIGDLIRLTSSSGHIIQVSKIQAPKGVLTFYGSTLEGRSMVCPGHAIAGRFDPVFDGWDLRVNDQCFWDGRRIARDRRVISK